MTRTLPVALTVSVTIPGTPGRSLSQNARLHWRIMRRDARQARGDACYATYGAINDAGVVPDKLTLPLTLDIVIAWEKGRKRMDQQNAVGILKATVDGVADALRIDDRHFIIGAVEQQRDPNGLGFVCVIITEATQ